MKEAARVTIIMKREKRAAMVMVGRLSCPGEKRRALAVVVLAGSPRTRGFSHKLIIVRYGYDELATT